MKSRLLNALFLLVLSTAACSREDVPVKDDTLRPVRVWCSAGAHCAAARSLCPHSDDYIGHIALWAYLDGEFSTLYSGSADQAQLYLHPGRTYHIYALANIPWAEAPALESDLAIWRCTFDDEHIHFPDGLPMASATRTDFSTDEGGDIFIRLVRLTARYCLSIGRADPLQGISQRLTFSTESVVVRNCPADITPFGSPSCPTASHPDGEGSCLEDLEALCCGGQAEFYLLEAANGCVEGISEERFLSEGAIAEAGIDPSLCPRIEVTGRMQYSDARTGSVYLLDRRQTYRFYLGGSMPGDLNLHRGYSYSGRLTYSGSDTYWKDWRVTVDRVDLDETFGIFFCDSLGMPVDETTWACAETTPQLWWRIFPDNGDEVELVLPADMAGLHLELSGETEDMGDGIFRQTFINDSPSRPGTRIANFTVKNLTRGIRAGIVCRLPGSSTGLADWDEGKDDNLYF